ncbi:MAG: hypothetical protein CMC50_02225 [Flavobacteriaceae bacterium]|nr:hypothetical protein [Flavobacteriaceae bacterium]
MKNLLFVITFIALFLSCDQPAPSNTDYDKGIALFEKNKVIANESFNLFIAKDLEGMMDMHSESLIWSPASTTDSLSKDEFRTGMKEWMTEFDEFRFIDRQFYPGVNEDFIPNGSVRTYGTWLGTHKSGKETVTKYYSVLEFNEDGKITADLEYFDVGGVFDQLEETQKEE